MLSFMFVEFFACFLFASLVFCLLLVLDNETYVVLKKFVSKSRKQRRVLNCLTSLSMLIRSTSVSIPSFYCLSISFQILKYAHIYCLACSPRKNVVSFLLFNTLSLGMLSCTAALKFSFPFSLLRAT